MTFLQDLSKGLVLDGAMSTPLENTGINTKHSLWTAKALDSDPDKVFQVHLNYYKAGADVAITDSYQANLPAFIRSGYSEEEAVNFIKKSVILAKKARDQFEKESGTHKYVAASIGSYGAFLADGSEYRGDYHLTDEDYLNFHLPRLKAVLSERPDLIALETQPRLDEVKTLLLYLEKHYPSFPVYVSFTLKNASQISCGINIQEAVKEIADYPNLCAIGINCVKPNLIAPALQKISQVTSLPLVAYPNRGADYNPVIKKWEPLIEEPNFYELTKKWYKLGARLIGGCCTTTETEIAEIYRALSEIRKGEQK